MVKSKIKLFTLFLVFVLLISGCAPKQSPQVWQKTFGGSSDDSADSIQQTSDGGYIVTGSSILKLDSNGDLVWKKTFKGEFHSIQQITYGGYIAAGYTAGDVYILKLDKNGNLVWQKIYGGSNSDEAYSIQQTSDGGYIVAGYTDSFGAVGHDVYILKLNADGNLVWQKTFDRNAHDYAFSIQQTSDGGYIVAGKTSSFGTGSSDVYILKLDADGNLVWQKTFGGSGVDGAYSIQQTSDGGYIVAGWKYSFEAGNDVYILKLDSNGNLKWQKTYGGSYNDWAYSIQQTSDGGYIVAGGTESFGAGEEDVYILKLDSNGTLVWQKTFGESGNDLARSIQQTSDGGYIVAGLTNSFGAGGWDVYVLKLDANGNTGPYPTK